MRLHEYLILSADKTPTEIKALAQENPDFAKTHEGINKIVQQVKASVTTMHSSMWRKTPVPPPAIEIPEPPTPPKRYPSRPDRDSLILAELREIKGLLKLIKDRM